MAKAITKINKRVPDPVEEQRQAIEQLIEMTADSRNALFELMEIAQRLEEFGMLEAVRAMLNKGHKVSALAIQEMNKPGTYRLVKNMIGMVEFLSAMEPAATTGLTNGLSKGMEKATESLQNKEQTNVWDLLKVLKDPDINAAMTAGLSFLKGIGEHLRVSSAESNGAQQ